MQRCPGGLSESYRVSKRRDGQLSGHPRVDRVAHDPVRAHVFDGAEIKLAFVGPVLGDIGHPQLVQNVCGEIAEHKVVVAGRAGFPV